MKHSLWLWARILFLFVLFVVIGLLPALSVIPASAVPPLADMQVSEGTISFRPVGGKSGSLTVIKKDDGHRDEFTCRATLERTHSCLHPRYEGEVGQVHRFWVKPLIGESYKYAAQIVVNGEAARARSTAIEQIEDARIFYQFVFAPLIFIAFVACVFFMVAPKGAWRRE